MGIDRGGVVGPETGLAPGGVGIVAAQPLVGGVVVDHRVHIAGGDAEEESGLAQFLEIPQVILPVGLRQNGHAQSLALQHTPDDRRPERGVIHIGVAVHNDDIHIVPPQVIQLFLGNWKKMFVIHYDWIKRKV